MSFFTKKGYQESVTLQAMAQTAIKLLPELSDAGQAKYHIMFSKNETEELAGKCRKLDGAIKHITGLDFLILIHMNPFMEMNTLRKYRVVCHELYHIRRQKKSWDVRHHEGTFCELEGHDQFSFGLASRVTKP